MTAQDLFVKLLKDNNLTISLNRPTIRFIENGGFLVDQSQLLITYTIPPVVEGENVSTQSSNQKVA